MRNMCAKFILSFAFLSLTVSCGSTIKDISSDEPESNVDTTESNGIVTATIDPKIQALIVAGKSSKVSGSYVNIPAGTLQVKTDINVGEGADKGEDVLGALGIDLSKNKIGKQTNPLFVGGDEDTEAAKPLTLAIPLPVDKDSLGLTAGEGGKLVLIYLIYTDGVYKAGIKVLGDSDFVGTYLKTKVDGFGIYIIAYLTSKVKDKEVTVNFGPSLK